RARRVQPPRAGGLPRIRRSRIGCVFQFFNLLPTLTAVENVALPLLLAGHRRRKALEPAYAGLERVGLRDRAPHFPDELSGGEMQRVAIARALVLEPEAGLCAGATRNQDSGTLALIRTLLRGPPCAG